MTAKGLHIADGVSLPVELLTSTQAIIAQKRSGKSYTASVEAEEMLERGFQICVLDPTSAWFGLRSSADGKGPGYPVVVFGGDHADAPLDYRSGKAMAKALVEHGFSAIFDIGDWITDEQIQFVFEFSSEMLRINKNAIHLFIDEADTFAPQLLEGKEQKKCLGAMSRMVKQGGIKGIGITLITQRSADLNKKLLSQIDMLTVLRIRHPPDMKPVTEWISANVGPAYASDVATELPRLEVGEAYVCDGPRAKGMRVKIRQRRTFNSGATPKPGEERAEPKVLAPVDIQKLGEKIAASVEEQKANDPEALKRRIRELEAQAPSRDEEREKMLGEAIQKLESDLQGANETIEDLRGRIVRRDDKLSEVRELARKLNQALSDGTEEEGALPGAVLSPQRQAPFRLPPSLPMDKYVATVPPPRGDGGQPIKAGARRMLGVLCQWYPKAIPEGMMAAQAQMKRTGGTFGDYKSVLRSNGFITIGADGRWAATKAGVDFMGANVHRSPRSTQEVVDLWSPKLKAGARRMLEVLIKARGHTLSREALGLEARVSAEGGTFGDYLSALRTAELVVVDAAGVRANREALFL